MRRSHQRSSIDEGTLLLPIKQSFHQKSRKNLIAGIVCLVVLVAATLQLFSNQSISSSNFMDMREKEKWNSLPDSPHIIMILADDLGFNDVGWAGDDFEGLTPTLDEMRNTGIELKSYYTQQLCTPARAALLSGRYPFKTGMQSAVVQLDEKWGLPLEFSLLPQYLATAGYKSYGIGKWHMGHSSHQQLPQERGFNEFYGFVGPEEHYSTHKSSDNSYLDFMHGIQSNSSSTTGSSFSCVTDKDGMHSTSLFTDKALSIVERWKNSDDKNPIMLYLSYQNAHSPLEPDLDIDYSLVGGILDKISDPFRRKVGMLVHGLDLEVKRLMDGLEEAGILNNSIIIFASDNGGCMSNGQSNYPLRGLKGNTFEGGSRVRSFIRSPLLPDSTKGKYYSGLFHVTDWVPTLMDASIPGWSSVDGNGGDMGLDGISHWEALVSGDMNASVRTEMVYNIQSILNPDISAGGGHQLVPRGAIRKDNWKLVVNEACQIWSDFGGRYNDNLYTSQCTVPSYNCNGMFDEDSGTWLFNLDEDPYETNDLSSEEPAIVGQLQRRLEELAFQAYPSTWTVTSPDEKSKAVDAWVAQGCISPWDNSI